MATDDELICDALAGRDVPLQHWSARRRALTERAAFHGVAPLLMPVLSGRQGIDPNLIAELRSISVGHVLWEAQHKELLTEALGALAQAGLRPIVIKGTALAYTLYED